MRAINHPDSRILGAAMLYLGGAFGLGLCDPALFWLTLAAGVAAGVTMLAWRLPTAFCVVWLVITSASLEMTLNDLVGPEMFQATIAGVKAIEIVLALLCALRFGARADPFSPVWAYLAMLAGGTAHGLYPGLTLTDSVRSFIGSAAPFAFCFCRLPRSWGPAIIRATQWCPALVVLACIPLDLAGLRPLFVDSGGARLAGLGHPAFLANVCLPAIYACLIQLYRTGRGGDLWLLAANLLILVLTGARAPMAYAVAVTAISIVSIRSSVFPANRRLLLVLLAGAILPVLALLSGDLYQIRLFNVVANETVNLSGRTLLWPSFENAAAQSPWIGWGIGAGNLVISPVGEIAETLHTRAAHNEYLRMLVEGGQIGRTLLIALFTAWVYAHTRPLPAAERRIMRLAFVAFGCHAATDNVLISTPACVLFAFATAVFAQGPQERTPKPEAAPARLILPDSARVA